MLEVDKMKAEVLKQVEKYGFVEITGPVCRTLDRSWLKGNGLMTAMAMGYNSAGSDEYVIYRPRLERTANVRA